MKKQKFSKIMYAFLSMCLIIIGCSESEPNKDTDKGGYNVLDVVFGDAMQAELVVKPFEMKGADGNIVKGNTYAVRSYDEDGEVYECPVKPARTSDKTFLNMLLR